MECGWTIVGFCERVIEDNCVGFVVSANSNSVKGLIFDVGALRCVVDGLVPVTNQKELEPGFGVWFDAVDEFER